MLLWKYAHLCNNNTFHGSFQESSHRFRPNEFGFQTLGRHLLASTWFIASNLPCWPHLPIGFALACCIFCRSESARGAQGRRMDGWRGRKWWPGSSFFKSFVHYIEDKQIWNEMIWDLCKWFGWTQLQPRPSSLVGHRWHSFAPLSGAVGGATLLAAGRRRAASSEEKPWTTTGSGLQYRDIVRELRRETSREHG